MSATPQVIDALIAAFTAAGHTVYDGNASLPGTWPAEMVIVGGTEDPDEDAATNSYTWAGLGAKAQNEESSITCCVVVQGGGTDIKPKRDRAYALLADLTAAIKTDPTLGAAVTSGWLLVTESSLRQRQNDRGSYARVPFAVQHKNRI